MRGEVFAELTGNGKPEYVGQSVIDTVVTGGAGVVVRLASRGVAAFAARGGPRRIVIGEDMARVRASAQKLGAETFEGTGMEANRAWIHSKMEQGHEVYDIGTAFSRRLDRFLKGNRPDSPFYGMERMETKNYPVVKMWERLGKWQGGSPFLGE